MVLIVHLSIYMPKKKTENGCCIEEDGPSCVGREVVVGISRLVFEVAINELEAGSVYTARVCTGQIPKSIGALISQVIGHISGL